MAFRSKLRNVKVSDVGAKVKDEVFWTDPVHLTESGYKLVAQHVLGGLEAMEDNRRSAGDGDGDAKRRRDDGASRLTANKRAANNLAIMSRDRSQHGEATVVGSAAAAGVSFRGGGGWGGWRGWPAGGHSSGFY
jgi:hypothetical protein